MAGTSIWTQAITQILAVLNAAMSPATAYRARFEAVAASDVAYNVFPHKIDVKQDASREAATVDASVVIRIYVADTDQVDLALDPLVVWAWQQIRQDPTLGGLVTDVYVDNIEIGYLDKSSSDQVCADMTIRVEVDVSRDDPSVNKTYPGA